MKKMEAIALVLISVLLGVSGQLSLKQGMRKVGNFELEYFLTTKVFEILKEKFIIIGIFCYAIATLIWLVVLSKAELSFAYPLLAIGYVLIAIFSKFLFNENVTFVRFLGIILISIGVFLLLRSA
ncbi:MAG: EamA family transporter [Candidatus Aenigmarchaeota archaeon]|jgi:multidrug transporter EmrE-like cation transporter|nr:EamA family transporter [Candidatus Aenigmarchaeota archaeon]